MKYFFRALKRNFVQFKMICTTQAKPVHNIKRLSKQYRDLQDQKVDSICNEIKQFAANNNMVISPPTKELLDYKVLSFNGDRMGKVIESNGEILRVIYPESADSFKKIWETGLLQVLGRHGIIPKTEITDYYTKEYPIIISHEKVEMSPSSLWNDRMILDAILLICFIREIAQKIGFTLHDGHLNNVTFHHGKPMFTDIGSIVENHGQPTICDREILFTGCYRLISRQLGSSILKHIQLYDESNNMIWIGERNYNDMVMEYWTLLKAYSRFHLFHSGVVCRRIISRVFKAYDVRAEFLYALFYHKNDDCNTSNEHLWYRDAKEILYSIQKWRECFNTITDISGFTGESAIFFWNNLGTGVSAAEADERDAERAYCNTQKDDLPINIYSFNYLYGASEEAIKPLMADMVIAIDLSNTCVSYQQYRLDSVLNSLGKLCKKYVAITYYPLRKKRVKFKGITNDLNWAVSSFDADFSRQFDLLEKRIIDNQETENYCILYIGRLKKYEGD